MRDELTVISEADLTAMDNDRKAYLGLSVILFNRLLRVDSDFKASYEYDKAMEVLKARDEASL